MASNYDTIYVAVREAEASRLTLLWTLHNLCPLQVCFLHVHQPSKMISATPYGGGGDLDETMFDQRQLSGVDVVGKEMMHRIMNECVRFCHQAGVSATSVYIQKDNVANGLVLLIRRHNIKMLVMGAAAADEHFSEGMWLMSKKAQYVNENAPLSCQIWFICYQQLIHTRFETRQSSNAPSPSDFSNFSSSGDAVSILNSTVFEKGEQSECELKPYVEVCDSLSMPNVQEHDRSSNDQLYDQLYDQLEKAQRKAGVLNRKAFEEYERRVKAEIEATQAMRRAKQFERLYNERMRETEAAQTKQNEDFEKMKRQVANSDYKMKQLEDKLSSAVKQLQISQKERHELQVELQNTRETEELLRKQAEIQSPLTEFYPSEIQEATENFHPYFKIADGCRGSVHYICVLRHIEVAVKVLGRNSLQDLSEFQQEIDDLSKPRHPNLVTLIGACPDIRALIYEYVPNGSLEDRLNCRNDTPPLSSQTRIRIATELCSTLMFLHSSKPHSVVHGNLKPGNILLDANFGCKLSDFGAHRALSLLENSSNEHPYLDPDFCNTGRLSHSLDSYPFGIILLQLLSGRSTQAIAETAQNALNRRNLNSFLDSSAGKWPPQVEQLTRLAIRCCDINRCHRPDLASEVLEVLETMRPSGASLSFLPESDEDNVMMDPHVAADGYTYEATALQEWQAHHDTSPMTNLRLPRHNLIPNFPLRSAIQQWQQNR